MYIVITSMSSIAVLNYHKRPKPTPAHRHSMAATPPWNPVGCSTHAGRRGWGVVEVAKEFVANIQSCWR
jgi:hypothetical protein